MDPMVLQAIARVKKDEEARKSMHGPSEVRERFTSKYWRKWNDDKRILDQKSLSKLFGEPSNDANDTPQDSLYYNFDKRIGQTFSKETKKKFFDYHLLGDNSVRFLMKEGLHRQLPSAECIDMLPKAAVSYPHIKGGLMETASKEFKSKSCTVFCDYPQLSKPTDGYRGTTFPLASRFKHR